MIEKDRLPDWDAFQEFFQKELESGLADWQIDLRNITTLDSLSIGNLIATNGQLTQRGCRLNLLIKRNSVVDRLFVSAKLNRLLPITHIG